LRKSREAWEIEREVERQTDRQRERLREREREREREIGRERETKTLFHLSRARLRNSRHQHRRRTPKTRS
jgi:hypothetical protein